MAVTIKWDNPEKTVLRYCFIDSWSWDEYLEQLKVGREMMESVPHYVCILNDMTQMTSLPPNFITLARSIIGSRPQNTGLVVFVSNSTFFKAMHNVLGKVLPEVPTHYLLAETEDEAYERFQNWFTSQTAKSND